MVKFPSRQTIHRTGAPRDLGSLLLEIVDREGPALLSQILKDKTRAQAQAETPSAKGLATRALQSVRWVAEEVRDRGVMEFSRQQSRKTLMNAREKWLAAQALPKVLNPLLEAARSRKPEVPTLRQKGEVALFSLLYSGSFLGGLFLGLQLPDVDVSLSRQGSSESGVIVHSAPAFTVDTTFRWLAAVVHRTLEHPSVGEEDRRGLRAIETLLETLLGGVHTGMATQKMILERVLIGRKKPQVSYALDDEAYSVLETVFQSLGPAAK